MPSISFRLDEETSSTFQKIRDELKSDISIRLKKSDVARLIFERGIKDIQKHGIIALTDLASGKLTLP